MKRLTLLGIIIISLIFTGATVVLAEPEITYVEGAISDGEDIIISGNGFGEKFPASPLIWDDFEDGAPGMRLEDNPKRNWKHHKPKTYTIYPLYSDEQAYGGKLSAHNDVQVGDKDQFGTAYQEFTLCNEVYYSYMYRFDHLSGNGDGQLKLGRIGCSEPAGLASPWYYVGVGGMKSQDNIMRCSSYTNYGYDARYDTAWHIIESTSYYWSPDDVTKHPSEWVRIENYGKLSDPGSENGIIWYALNGKETENRKVKNVEVGWGNTQYKYVLLGTMLANPGTDTRAKLYVDNVYVDNTRARVEIGESAVFTDCTRKDPQIPSVWSDGSITAQVNLGTFQEGETAYVYVVDKDGNASQGYPVTIGEEKTNLSMSMQATGKYGVNIPQGENFEFITRINNPTFQQYNYQLLIDSYRGEELYKTGLCGTPTGVDIPAESTLELDKIVYISKDTTPGPYAIRAYLLDGNSEVASAELEGTVEPPLGRRRQTRERATK